MQNPEFDFMQMLQIKWGLAENLNISIYAKPKYTWEQMDEIRSGLIWNLDVSWYAKPELNQGTNATNQVGVKKEN